MKYFDQEKNQLIFEEQKADSNFWDTQWDILDFKKSVEAGKNDRFVSGMTKKFIPPSKSRRILEGGCGRGNFVYALDYHGYDVYGVDFAEKTVQKTNSLFPHLKISRDDVRKLSFPDNYFDGYWSLGVIEHFFDGYDEIAKEMYRVIKPGGFLFLTFPHMSPLRKLKAKLGRYPRFSKEHFNKENFYQFALNSSLVQSHFEKLGFSVAYKKSHEGFKGLKDEVSWLKKPLQILYNNPSFPAKVIGFAIATIFAPFSGHVSFFVLKKNTER